MDFFEKHKALVITVLFCSVLILGLYNFNLSQKRKIQREMLVELEEYTEAEESEEEIPEEQVEPDTRENQNPSETHRAFNENQEAREENFNRELDEIFEKNSAEQEENSESKTESSPEGTFGIGSNSETKERSDGDESSKDISTQSGSLRNSSISFSLRGRNAISIPNPIYTCDLPGKIVVNITVNSEGRVIETGINKASSNSDNECLTERALEYAENAVFSSLAGRNEQPGTITYNFKP